MDYLIGLYWFAGLFIAGLILSTLASKVKMPSVLFLIILGIIAGKLGFDISDLSPEALIAFGLFALIMILFDSTSKFNINEVKKFSPYAAKISLLILFLCAIFLTLLTHILFFPGTWAFKSILLSLLFSILVVGTAPDIVLSILTKIKAKAVEVLQFESIINTPLTVILPLIILDLYQGIIANSFILHFLGQIMTGIGTGLIIGLIIFNIISNDFWKRVAPLLIIATAIGCYALSEALGGNGVLAVTTLGIIFNRTRIKKKVELQKFTDMFTDFLRIVVFILLGLMITIPVTPSFLIKSGILFIFYLFMRFTAVNLTFGKKSREFSTRERIFMGLNAPKGIAVAVVIFIIKSYNITALDPILSLVFAFIIYSIILSTIMVGLEKYFLNEKKIYK